MRLLDESGRPSGPERRLTETPDASYEASLERLGDVFAVAWYEQTSDGRQTAMLGEWNRDGSQKWVQAIAPASRNPVIVADGQAIIAAWIQTEPDSSEWVYMGTWDRDGRESRTRTRVGVASKTTWNLNIAVDRSGAWIVYDAAASTRASELFLARVDGSGAHLARLTKDDGAESKYPDLKISDEGRVALTWYDMRDGNDEVYLFVGSQSDMHGEIDDRSRRVTMTDGESIGAYLAWNGGRGRARVVGQDARRARGLFPAIRQRRDAPRLGGAHHAQHDVVARAGHSTVETGIRAGVDRIPADLEPGARRHWRSGLRARRLAL